MANGRIAASADGRQMSLPRAGILNYEWSRKVRQVNPTQNVQGTPEPATIWLVAAALLGMAWSGKKRLQNNSIAGE